jgi:hypothetical protein
MGRSLYEEANFWNRPVKVRKWGNPLLHFHRMRKKILATVRINSYASSAESVGQLRRSRIM